MELGLTLGGGGGDSVSSSSVPLKTSACLALSLGVNSSEIRNNHQEPLRSDDNPTASMDSSHARLDLFPLWSPPEITKTESSEMGLSGAAVWRLDANLSLAVEEVEAVSSPKSVASTLHVDFGGERKRESAEAQASDEDENSLNRKKLRLSKGQAAFLEETFKEHNTLNPKQKQALAKQLNLRPRQVEVWFQNRRARTKLKQTEVDCEYLKRCCETLTTENRRLHKELQELRALKSSNPYSTREPATTLTMCPSCERTTSTTNTATSSASAVTTAVSMSIAEPTSRSVPFPLSRPKFFPYSSHSNPPKKSLAS